MDRPTFANARDAWLKYVDTDIFYTDYIVKENERNMDERRLMMGMKKGMVAVVVNHPYKQGWRGTIVAFDYNHFRVGVQFAPNEKLSWFAPSTLRIEYQNGYLTFAEAYAKRGLNAQYGTAYVPKKVIYDEAAGITVVLWFMRMIVVYLDITAPLYWWKEFDTYKVGTVANSCSTMHKIPDKEFTLDDFSHEHLIRFNGMPNDVIMSREYPYVDVTPCQTEDVIYSPLGVLKITIEMLNNCRMKYLTALKTESETGLSAKDIWWQLIQLLPSSYNQRRTVMLNYEVLANMYKSRRHHKLDEWHTFCDWVESLPYSELITGKDEAKASAESDGKE